MFDIYTPDQNAMKGIIQKPERSVKEREGEMDIQFQWHRCACISQNFLTTAVRSSKYPYFSVLLFAKHDLFKCGKLYTIIYSFLSG
jgi:hypothetical protein